MHLRRIVARLATIQPHRLLPVHYRPQEVAVHNQMGVEISVLLLTGLNACTGYWLFSRLYLFLISFALFQDLLEKFFAAVFFGTVLLKEHDSLR
jgi:hypothetical protein